VEILTNAHPFAFADLENFALDPSPLGDVEKCNQMSDDPTCMADRVRPTFDRERMSIGSIKDLVLHMDIVILA
jgi:hypothetical protein